MTIPSFSSPSNQPGEDLFAQVRGIYETQGLQASAPLFSLISYMSQKDPLAPLGYGPMLERIESFFRNPVAADNPYAELLKKFTCEILTSCLHLFTIRSTPVIFHTVSCC